MKDGFIKVASATPEIKVADCEYNAKQIIKLIKEAYKDGVSLIIFPELCITAYTCLDLFFQSALLDGAENALLEIAKETKNMEILSVVGLPLRDSNTLYNCAAVLYKGEILGFVPKVNIPNYSEFQELRFFDKGIKYKRINFHGNDVPMGSELVFVCDNIKEFKLGIEICEDLWVPCPPSCNLAKAGATIIANLSASNELVSKSNYRKDLVKMQSSKLICAYIYSDAGLGESTTDLVYSGHNMICEDGTFLAEAKRFTTGIITAEVDLERIEIERRKSTTSFSQTAINEIHFTLKEKDLELKRNFPQKPFVPSSKSNLNETCEEILNIQAQGLIKRLSHINAKNVVLGLSGGLDSTLALIVTVRAFDYLKLKRSGIITVTMPCFGTTSRTKSNAQKLSELYNTSFLEIPIKESVCLHFKDIGHDENLHDTTYENSQARERTQILMDLSNKYNGIVIGTGDLSELALGFATYNGDHMSMYSVNCSVPKTLVKHIVEHQAKICSDDNIKALLFDILNTPVSPELLPPDEDNISQKTEEIVGPYELHDFFLYYLVRLGFTPSKILRLAKLSFEGVYHEKTIEKFLKLFLKRFFNQQFKRSCLPDGPKVGSVSLSPRGDFRMPSDASYKQWLNNLKD